jgi:hypothetical protein
MPEDLLPLEQLARLDHPIECLLGHEPVVDALALARSGCARRGGDREVDRGVPLADQADDGPLADP